MASYLAVPAALTAFIVSCIFAAAVPAVAAADNPFNIKIVNESEQPDSNVYVMLHDNAGTAASTDGQLTDGVAKKLSDINNSTVAMGDISAARLFISYGAAVTPSEPNDNSTTTRYDKIEFTNPGVANLTAVDFFGIPLSLQALDSSGNTVGNALAYRCYTSTLSPQLAAAGPSALLNNGSQFVRNWAPGLFPQSYASMASYLQSMAGQTITIDDRFDSNGPPPVHDAINYTGTFGPDGSITLNGTLTPDGGSASAGLPVAISGSNLNGTAEPGIYTANGDYTKGGNPGHVGDNDQYAVIYRDVVSGFAFGYWGGRYGNAVSDWKSQPGYAAARTTTQPYATFNQYAAAIADYSPAAYGYAFSDMGPTPVVAPLNNGGPTVATLELVIEPDNGPNIPGCVGTSTSSPSPSPPSTGGGDGDGGGQSKISINNSVLKLDKRGRALVELSCSGDPCSGELTLTATREQRRPKRRAKKRRRTLVGHTNFRLSEGQTRGIFVTVSRKGRNLISSARGRRLPALAKASVGPIKSPTVVSQKRVTLESYKPPRKHKRSKRKR